MNCKKVIAGIALALGVQASASAAIVTVDGAFFDISYDSALVGFFGTPTIVGSSIVWSPSQNTGFYASAGISSPQVDVTSSTFDLKITADSGYALTGSSLSEGGNYYTFGSATHGVQATGDLWMTGLGPLAGPVHSSITTSTFLSNALFDFSTKAWTGTAAVSLGTAVDSAQVSIYNLLAAWAVPPDVQSSYIEKRNVTLSVAVAAIPEPSTWAMLGLGVGMIGFALRRKMR